MRGTQRASRPAATASSRTTETGSATSGRTSRSAIATVTLDVVDDLDEALRIANEETSGLAAGIVTEDADAANRFLDGYRGTAAFWHATTRFTDGYELTGAPETGINVDTVPGPRGPVTYRDLWLRQYRVVGTAPRPVDRPVVVKLGTGLVVGADGGPHRPVTCARARDRDSARGGEPVCVVSSGAIALGLPKLGLRRRPRSMAQLQAASALGQAKAAIRLGGGAGRRGIPAAQILLAAGDVADRTAYVNARQAFAELFRLGAVPVVNENDATATDEITFGDNDALAAQVAVLVRAQAARPADGGRGRVLARARTPGAELLPEGELPSRPSSGRHRARARRDGEQGARRRRWRAPPGSRP